jgi:hypothetical protein
MIKRTRTGFEIGAEDIDEIAKALQICICVVDYYDLVCIIIF